MSESDILEVVTGSSESNNEGRLAESENEDGIQIPPISEMAIKLPEVKVLPSGKRIYMYQCTQCKSEYKVKDICIDHYYATHLNIRRHVCQVCGSTFINQSSMQLHQRIKHNMFSGPPKKKRKKKTKSPNVQEKEGENLKEKEVNEGEETSTSTLQQKFSTPQKGKRRMITNPENPDYSKEKIACDYCGREFNWKSNLNAHKRKYHPSIGVNFKCKYCDRGFKWLGSYHFHIKKFHTGSPVLCDSCGNVFSDSAATEVHSSAVTAKCEVCSEECKSQCVLTQHYVKYFEELKCCKCPDVKFSNFFTLWKHKSKVHLCETIMCCQKNYMRIKTYQKHLKYVHYNIKTGKTDDIQRNH